MVLELADNNESNFLNIPYENKVYKVNPAYFDKLNDYEFSNLFLELQEVNKIDPIKFIRERDIRRSKINLPPTKFNPTLSGGVPWLKKAGAEIKSWFHQREILLL